MSREEPNPMLPLLNAAAAVIKNWWTPIAGLCLGLAAGTAVLTMLPKIYEAQTTIFVEPPKIPAELVRSTVNTDMAVQMAALEEAMLSRPYMERLLETTLGLPEDPVAAEQKIRTIQKSIQVSSTPIRLANNQHAGYFDLTYRHTDPVMVAKVVNTLAQLWLEENAQTRAESAASATETMSEIAQAAREEIQTMENAITDFKSQNQYSLPENLDANLSLLESARSSIETTRLQIQTAQANLQNAQANLRQYESERGAGSSAISERDRRIEAARNNLARLEQSYQPAHPDVVKAKQELEDALAVPQTGGNTANPLANDPAYITLASRVDSLKLEISGLQEDLRRRQQSANLYQQRIDRTPAVAQELARLSAGFDAKRREYEDVVSREGRAKQAQVLENNQQGKQFTIAEAAVVPSIPVSPQPLIIYGVFAMLGLGLFVGPVLLLAILAPKVNSEEMIGEITDVPVLVNVPRIASPTTKATERRKKLINWGLSAASLLVLVSVVLTWGG